MNKLPGFIDENAPSSPKHTDLKSSSFPTQAITISTPSEASEGVFP